MKYKFICVSPSTQYCIGRKKPHCEKLFCNLYLFVLKKKLPHKHLTSPAACLPAPLLLPFLHTISTCTHYLTLLSVSQAEWTPLHYASMNGHLEICKLLLAAGAAVDAKDNVSILCSGVQCRDVVMMCVDDVICVWCMACFVWL